jgi:thiaminase/transcriptional activator TenA
MSQDIFTQLRDANPQVWDAYTRHQFVEQLGAGTLHKSSFQHYLIQDYQFLKQFIRALALGVYKAEILEDMRFFQGTIDAILNTEMALHIAYSKEWGIAENTLENTVEAQATIAYTRYVLDVAMMGDVLDLMVALSPCMLGYAEIATQILPLSPVDNPYQPWVLTYSGEEYKAVAAASNEYLNTLFTRLGTPQRLAKLNIIFSTATQLEAAFWQQSL